MNKNLYTNKVDSIEAIEDIARQACSTAQRPKFTILFISSSYELPLIASKLKTFVGEVVACTTGGEISSKGNGQKSISGMSFYGEEFEISRISLKNLDKIKDNYEQYLIKVSELDNKMTDKRKNMDAQAKSFGMLFIDGLSGKEEYLSALFANQLPGIPVIGGSAGDNLSFKETFVYQEGEFCSNAAEFIVITTTRSFEIFKTQHFKQTDTRFIITEAVPEKRIVNEINGVPAADYYAEALGLKVEELDPSVFSKAPLIMNIGNDCYVRSIQKVNDDKSLTFFCAIDRGVILKLAESSDLYETNNQIFADMEAKMGNIDSCLLFECVLRKLEILSMPDDKMGKMRNFYNKVNATGMYTYGEQYGPLHVNQTMVGVAFGEK